MLRIALLLLSSVTTLAQYCSCGPTTTVDANLGYTAFTGDTKNFSDSSDCPGYIGPKDLTYLYADIHAGGTYTLVYNVTTCGNVFPTVSGAWIDFDQDGQFQSTEALFPFNRSNGLITNKFTINSSLPVKPGMTRMRVQVQETSATNPLDPCSRFAYGGTKDFNISITNYHCNSGPTTTTDGNLGPVYLKGDSMIISDTIGCPGQIGPIDESNMTADLTSGAFYTINYTVTTCGDRYNSLTTAWIDYNGNTILEDWERIIPYSTKFGVNSVTFRPATTNGSQQVKTGVKLWMRVQMQETDAVSLSPCVLFPYGGTKDFSIILKDNPYCSAGPTQLNGVQLGPVKLVGATESINDTTGCPGEIGVVLLLSESANLIQLQTFTLNYTVVSCGLGTKIMSAAWIDFNQNQKFDAWEQITPFSTLSLNSHRFKIPPSTNDEEVKAGPTRLRVQVQGVDDFPKSIDPCNQNFVHGGTKDFTVTIITTSSIVKLAKI